MPRRKAEPPPNDKERILAELIHQLAYTQSQAVFTRRAADGRTQWDDPRLDGSGLFDQYTHFETVRPKDLKPGDFVLCMTSGHHRWKVGIVHEQPTGGDYGNVLLREIGGSRTCNVGNEMFYRIAGTRVGKGDVFLEGPQREFQTLVTRAIIRLSRNDTDCDMYRPGGIEFDGDRAIVRIRPHIFVTYAGRDSGKPHERLEPAFYVTFDGYQRKRHWTLTRIMQALLEAGMGTAWQGLPKEQSK